MDLINKLIWLFGGRGEAQTARLAFAFNRKPSSYYQSLTFEKKTKLIQQNDICIDISIDFFDVYHNELA